MVGIKVLIRLTFVGINFLTRLTFVGIDRVISDFELPFSNAELGLRLVLIFDHFHDNATTIFNFNATIFELFRIADDCVLVKVLVSF